MVSLRGLTVPTILVADDNSNIQKMVSLVFKEKGIRVVAVGNGEAACRKVPEVRPDVVLADVFMPVRNGYEVCEFVKQDPQFAETPVILLVGAFDPLDEKEAQRVGANGVLKKPFVPPDPLVDLVNSLLKADVPAEAAPQAVEAVPAPPPAPVAAAPVRQAPRAAVPNDYDDAQDVAPTFGEPVATPATIASADEETDDASDPTSEWARRRATMDYEIDASESANMVERLAAGNAAEEPEILPSNKHLPFGGANVSEMTVEAAPQPSHASWPDPTAPEVAAEKETAAQTLQQHARADESLAVEHGGDTEVELESGSGGEFSAPQSVIEEASSPEAEPAAAYGGLVLESSELTSDGTQEASPAVWSLPQTPQPGEVTLVHSDDLVPADSDDSAAISSHAGAPTAWQDTAKQMVEASSPVPMTSHPAIEADARHLTVVESGANETVAQEAIDQSTVDEVVAKVISKLEPHLHQALANGVLRPLVEEVLKQQRDKK